MELLGTLLQTIPELNWIGKVQCLLTEQGYWSDQYGSDKYSVVDITWEQLPDTTIHGVQALVRAVFIYKDTLYAAYNLVRSRNAVFK